MSKSPKTTKAKLKRVEDEIAYLELRLKAHNQIIDKICDSLKTKRYRRAALRLILHSKSH